MMNRVGLNTQTLRSDLPLVRNTPKLSSPLSFRGNEDDETIEIQPSEIKKEEPARKFSVNKALQNFGDGFIYPIRQAFSSVSNAAVTLTSLVVVKNLLKKLPELGKPLVAVTAGLGLYSIGKGIIKIIQNKNNPESQEKSFFDIGKGTAITALAGKCAKNALNAGKEVSTVASPDKLNFITEIGNSVKSVITCVKETPAAILSSYKTIFNNPKEIFAAVLPVLPKNIKDGLEAFSPGVAAANDININTTPDTNGIGAEGLLAVVQDKIQTPKDYSEQ